MMAPPFPILPHAQIPGEEPGRPLPPLMRTHIPEPPHHPLHIVLVSPSSLSAIHV
jgi:hypothetical protein